jgi:Tol biopolymer transport system component
MKKAFHLIGLLLILSSCTFAQFGKNKVQYRNYDWRYIQTKHFDIFYSTGGEKLAEFAAKASETALDSIESSYNYDINNRVSIIIYNSNNDFQETNVTEEYLSEGIEGFTEIFKNRVVIRFEGSYAQFRHLIHHELVHAVNNDLFYGGSFQNVISKNISLQLPIWFHEGMAEYQSLKWDTHTDMYIRDAIISNELPDITNLGGYGAYRGGQSLFYYISQKYGDQKIGEIIQKTKGMGNFEAAMKSALGIDFKELNMRWKKELKKTYWPDIAKRDDPDVFAKRLTDHKEDGGFYNTSPAISPQGDKIAFISNRNIYFSVYIMNAADGKIIKRAIEGNRTADFEELNVVTPGLTWSPDGKKIALAAKGGGSDVVYIIDVDEDEVESLPFKFNGIASVSWSPKGDLIAFMGNNAKESDIYTYNVQTKELKNITDDIFSDSDPAWTPDGQSIIFSSDRQNYLSRSQISEDFDIYFHDYKQLDLYKLNVADGSIERLTNMPMSDELFPAVAPDGKQILFISDANGIYNIYKKDITLTETDTVKSVIDNPAIPITNSLNGIYQFSLSADGRKLVFSSLYETAYDLFLLSNPFNIDLKKKTLEPTIFYANLESGSGSSIFTSSSDTVAAIQDTTKKPDAIQIFTGEYVDNTPVKDTSSDYSSYAFGKAMGKDTTDPKTNFEVNNLDHNGNYYVNPYKITFTPDLVYANAGYSTLYGLLGTTVLSFSDLLGDHRIIGVTSLQLDLKNSDYGVAYYYLPKRIDFGMEAFHTARFVYLQRGYYDELYRFRNYGLVLNASYPISRFYRIDGGLSWLNVSSENLDNPQVPTEEVSYIIPSMSFVHDNVLWGYTSPIEGTRYNLTLFGNPGFTGKKYSFFSTTMDYRHYFRFFYDYSFVTRLSGGFSSGANPQRFFMGGTENWINRSFATGEIPLNSASDYAFLSPAMPMRGFDYAEKLGSKYALINMELRLPIIRYLLTGGLPLFFQNILGTAFVDAGTAWDKTEAVKLWGKNDQGKIITKDLLFGTGVGARAYLLFFLVRFDVAWSYDWRDFSKPKYYISLGADF